MKQQCNYKHPLFIVLLTIAACLIYAISAGIRSNYGIMLRAISQNSGISYSSISFVLAVGQLVFGIMQPVFGVIALKKSNPFVLSCGVLLTVAGLLIIPFCKSVWMLLLFLGILLPSGTGALSFGIIMGAITAKLSENIASTVSGFVNASSGVGNTVLSPVLQTLIAGGSLFGAMLFLSVPTLILLPVSLWLCRPIPDQTQKKTQSTPEKNIPLKSLFLEALHNRTYQFLMIGFFTCGFYMAIIETHLYTQITTYGFSEKIAAYAFSIYGIFTMIGSVLSGVLCSRIQMRWVLGCLYGLRSIIVLFLVLPKTLSTICAFTALLGLTGNATVSHTSGLISRTFGAAKLATLFGFVFFVHQIGSFLSACLGGISISATGSYTLIWCMCALLCVLASFVSFCIRDPEKN